MKGFFTLASGMLTSNRRLTAVSNNISNVNTAGYKKERVSAAAFGNVLIARTGPDPAIIGETSLMTRSEALNVIQTQGVLESTGRGLDFAVEGEGFFAVQTAGGTAYTRAGSFVLDEEGYLSLPGGGRVLGADGNPLYLGTDEFEAGDDGSLYVAGAPAGRIGLWRPEGDLEPLGNALYGAAGAAAVENPKLLRNTLELSNVDAAEEMTAALSLQRDLQTAAQALKIYDAVQSKAQEIGRI